MHIFCNSGMNTTDMVGYMPGVVVVRYYSEVIAWYHSKGIANILSMAFINNYYQVTNDR